MVVPEGPAGEACEAVEKGLVPYGVMEPGALGLFNVENDVVPVCQLIPGNDLAYVFGCNGGHGHVVEGVFTTAKVVALIARIVGNTFVEVVLPGLLSNACS